MEYSCLRKEFGTLQRWIEASVVLPWGLLLDASHTWPIQASHHVCSRSSTLQADPILFISVENTHHCILTPTFAYKGYTFPAQIMVTRKTEYTHLASVRLESHYFCFLCSVNDHLLYCFPCCHIVMYQYFGICLCHFSLRLFPRSNLEIVNGRLLSWSRICL